MAEMGLILVKSNDDLNREEAERLAAEEEAQKDRVESSLSAHVRRVWECAKRAKQPHEERMLTSLRRLNGRYTSEKEAELAEQGLPAIYMRVVGIKCRAAKGWIRDILMPAGDKPWSLDTTPQPDLPIELQQQIMERVNNDAAEFMAATGMQITPEMALDVLEQFSNMVKKQVQRQAEIRVSRMEDLIADQLAEGGWGEQLDEVISDLVDYPAAILKAPVVRSRPRISWQLGEATVIDELIPEVERVDPLAFYPSPGVVNPDDGDVIEVHDYTKSDLASLKGLPGYDDDAINYVINHFSSLKDWARQSLQSRVSHAIGDTSSTDNETQTVEALEYWGSIQGQLLLDWGMSSSEVEDPDGIYQIMAVLVGSEIICVRFNPDPLGRNPYSKACFENVPGSFWGKSLPDIIGDCEDVCNAAARAIVANMGISSGPQVVVNMSSVPPGQDIKAMYPWKIWQLDYTKTGANTRPPIEFWQPNPMTETLMNVFKFYSDLADEYSGIPSYVYGNANVGGAGRTASGLSMLMNSASKGIKNVVSHIDRGIITPTIERYYDFNMLFSDDESIKGDAQVVARGATSLVMKEQNQMRVQELLQQTANPLDMQIMGIEGRAAMLRRAVQGVDVGADDIVPTAEELKQREQAAQAMAQQQQPVPPAELDAAGQPMGQQNVG